MFGIKYKDKIAPKYKQADLVRHKLGGPIGMVDSVWEQRINIYRYRIRYLKSIPEQKSSPDINVNMSVGGAGLIAGGNAASIDSDNEKPLFGFYMADEFELKKEESDAKS